MKKHQEHQKNNLIHLLLNVILTFKTDIFTKIFQNFINIIALINIQRTLESFFFLFLIYYTHNSKNFHNVIDFFNSYRLAFFSLISSSTINFLDLISVDFAIIKYQHKQSEVTMGRHIGHRPDDH